MPIRTLLLPVLAVSGLLAQTPEPPTTPAPAPQATPAAAHPEIGMLDDQGKVVTLQQTKMKSSSTTTVPFSGVKTKIRFEKPADLPRVAPGKLFLGKVPAEKGGAIHLARLTPDGEALLLKGRFPMKMAINLPFAVLDESIPTKTPLKETLSPEGIRVVELPNALEPGIYGLVRAMASQGFMGMNAEATAFLFEVAAAKPAAQ